MAGEVGHVVYAARILTHLGDVVKDPSYWAGTLFPDIRHLGIVSRKNTHIEGVSLKSLAGQNDFHTGMRVHAWIDATREQYLRKQNIKENIFWHPFVPHALKLVEDQMLYDKFDDWNLIHRILNKVHEDELHYVNNEKTIQQWHTVLQDYFKVQPNDESRTNLAVAIGLSESSAGEINSVVQRLQNDPKAMDVLFGFLEYLETILS